MFPTSFPESPQILLAPVSGKRPQVVTPLRIKYSKGMRIIDLARYRGLPVIRRLDVQEQIRCPHGT